MSNEEILKYNIVEFLRKRFSIGKYPNIVEKLCDECNLHSALLADEYGFEHKSINLTNLGIPEPFHKASLIGFNTDNGPKWYIVDPTYGQFFYEGNDAEKENIKNCTFKNYMFSNSQDFSTKLLDQGYIECTLKNMLYYINGFALSNAYTNDIDINEVYKKTTDFLLTNNIINKEINHNYQNLIDLIYLRQQIINESDDQINKKKNTL